MSAEVAVVMEVVGLSLLMDLLEWSSHLWLLAQPGRAERLEEDGWLYPGGGGEVRAEGGDGGREEVEATSVKPDP